MMTSLGAMAQTFDGVYQIVVEDQNGKSLSAGTGFNVYSEELSKSVLLTSFHLVNSVLLEASKIKAKISDDKYMYLSILGYDELNDILVLDAGSIVSSPLLFSNDCTGHLMVAGYHKGAFMAVGADGFSATKLSEAKRLSVYLTKGFSGAPVLDDNADVCGMVVLSSEQNASSVAVMTSALRKSLRASGAEGYGIRGLRVLMGVEHVVKTQEELEELMLSKSTGSQTIIRLSSQDTSDFIVSDADNVIIEADSNVGKITIHNSKKVMLRSLYVKRVIINNSSQVLIASSFFEKLDKPVLVKDSSDVLITGCVFKNTSTGVVLKSSIVDEQKLLSDNVFQSVQNITLTL